MRVYEIQARVRVPGAAGRPSSARSPPTVGVIEPGRPDATTHDGRAWAATPDWIARYLAGLPFPFEVLGPDEVREEVAALGRRLVEGTWRGDP